MNEVQVQQENFNGVVIFGTDEENVWVTSNEIAEQFGKQHKDVMEAIGRYVQNIGQFVRAENSALTNGTKNSTFGTISKYFEEDSYEYEFSPGRFKIVPRYKVFLRGMELLVMGFTGQKALEWKLKYIEAFHLMAKKLDTARKLIAANEEKIKFLEEAVHSYEHQIALAATRIDHAARYVQNLEHNFDMRLGGVWAKLNELEQKKFTMKPRFDTLNKLAKKYNVTLPALKTKIGDIKKFYDAYTTDELDAWGSYKKVNAAGKKVIEELFSSQIEIDWGSLQTQLDSPNYELQWIDFDNLYKKSKFDLLSRFKEIMVKHGFITKSLSNPTAKAKAEGFAKKAGKGYIWNIDILKEF